MTGLLLLTLLLQMDADVLDNPYAHVARNMAPCANAGPGCGDRVLVAMGDLEIQTAQGAKPMARGDIMVFEAGKPYTAPKSGQFLEVNLKIDHPPVQSPAELIAPEKNSILYDGATFFVFEEKLDPGETRARHSHSQRVVIVLNDTRLQQWPDGQPEVFRDQVPDNVHFNPPVIHVVKTIGAKSLRNIVIEFKKQG